MPYVGNTFRLSLDGGLDFNPDYDNVSPNSLVDMLNTNLHNGGIEPRGGCDYVNKLPSIYTVPTSYTFPNENTQWGIASNGEGTTIAVTTNGSGYWITRSTDSGETWTSIDVTDMTSPTAIAYANGRWIIVTLTGTYRVFYSDDDGETWNPIDVGTSYQLFDICYAGDDIWVIAIYTNSGYFYRSTDNGDSWDLVEIPSAAADYYENIASDGEGHVVAVDNTVSYIIYSSDYGATWDYEETESTYSVYNTIAYGDGVFLYGTGKSSIKEFIRIIFDGTSITQEVIEVEDQPFSYLTFMAYGNGVFMTVGSSYMFYSIDLGKTWNSYYIGDSSIASAVVCYDDYSDWFTLATDYGVSFNLSAKNNIVGLGQFTKIGEDINGSYLVDEDDNFLVDENGNYLIIYGADVITVQENGAVFVNYKDVVKYLDYDERCYFESFMSKLYIANGKDNPITWDGALDYALDMGTPSKCTPTLVESTGNIDAGDHYYAITYITESGESSAGSLSDVITTTSSYGQIQLTDIPLGDDGTTSRNIYRTEADGSDLLLLATLSDNTSTSYLDNLADGDLGTDVPEQNLAFLPTDWTSGMPKFFFQHARGTSRRLWAFGCSGYPSRIYASLAGLADFSDNNVTFIDVLQDEVTAMTDFGGNLFAFSRTKTYLIDDVSEDVADWGQSEAIWNAGCSSNRMICKSPSDVYVMSPDGNIYSIRATQRYGDFEIGSISKPFYINEWIKENIDLSLMDEFSMVYDKDLRAVKVFMVYKGDSKASMCLVYFIDTKTWSKHEFGFFITTVENIQETNVSNRVYFGDDSGNVYKSESDTLRDNDEIYESYFYTAPSAIGDQRGMKKLGRIWVVMKSYGNETLHIEPSVDHVNMDAEDLTMPGVNPLLTNYPVDLGALGQRLQLKFTNSDGNEYFISQVLVDYVPLGAY